MWYLVVPPIIVVLSLFFLLWYLLRKGADPVIAQKMLSGEKADTFLFPGLRGFFLKMIEKLAQRFKVGLLRAHNILNEFVQWVKKMRMKAETQMSVSETPIVAVQEEATQEPVSTTEGDTFSDSDISKNLLDESLVRRGRDEQKVSSIFHEEKSVFASRPIVSEVMTRPEIKKDVPKKNGLWEDGLIARIACDPKDFTAYEELGDHYLEAGNIKDAKECYRQVLKLSPVHRLVKIKIRRLEKILTRGGE